MTFAKHTTTSLQAVQDTFNHTHNFAPLTSDINRIYFVGSGSSYSQSIYGAQLTRKFLGIEAIYTNPYSFVKYDNITSHDLVIHLSQEAKRNDNRCPLLHAKRKGARTILFTSKTTDLYNITDEVYWFAPEIEKILVASMSYASGYAALLKWITFQCTHKDNPVPHIDYKVISDVMSTRLSQKFQVTPEFTCFLYAGFAQSVAVEGALKINECLLIDSESYELKHYSHGKHFVSYNKPRSYVVLEHITDSELVDLYKDTIFEPHHNITRIASSLSPELAVFEWLSGMLKYTVDGMQSVHLTLDKIPVRDSIRRPHQYKY